MGPLTLRGGDFGASGGAASRQMPHGGWGVLASWICAAAYQRPGFGGRRLVGRIRCFFLRKKAEPFGQKPLRGYGLRARVGTAKVIFAAAKIGAASQLWPAGRG